jgi:hypothetical protein
MQLNVGNISKARLTGMAALQKLYETYKLGPCPYTARELQALVDDDDYANPPQYKWDRLPGGAFEVKNGYDYFWSLILLFCFSL